MPNGNANIDGAAAAWPQVMDLAWPRTAPAFQFVFPRAWTPRRARWRDGGANGYSVQASGG